MAAIAPLDPYEALSRKIGYSVGLENLERNTDELTRLYVRERSVSFVNWVALVRDTFHRTERAAQEIANFFGSLDLIRIIGRELHVLHRLDCLSILYRYFEGDEVAYKRAARLVLLQAIVEADGDVFLPCLAAAFEPEHCRIGLEGMVRWKWDRLTKVMKNPGVQKKIWDAISIKSHTAAKATGGNRKPSAFEPRKGPSPFEPRKTPFGEAAPRDFKVADSYLDKVVPTRKGWAKDLGLFEDGKLTQEGSTLLSTLTKIGIGREGGPYFFWPYEQQLAKLRISPAEIEAQPLTDWDLIQVLAYVIGKTTVDVFNSENDYESEIGRLRKFHQLYKSGSADRGRIRHQLPLFMAKPLVVATALSEGRQPAPLPEIIDKEAHSQHRRLTVTNVRGTDGALVFSANAV